MNIKGRGLITGLLATVMSTTMVAAQNLPAPPDAIAQMGNFFSQVLLGQVLTTQIFSRLMIFLLVFTVLIRPSEAITKSRNMGLALSVIVTLLGMRAIPDDAFVGILLPYTAVLVAISVGMPILLFGTLVTTSDIPQWLRKIGWILFVVSFTVMWIWRFPEIGEMAYIYLIGSILSLLMFLFLDAEIAEWWYEERKARNLAVGAGYAAEIVTQEIRDLYNQLTKASDDATRQTLREQIKNKEKNLKEIAKDAVKGK
ncbi:hypothetical protein ACFLZZ_04605 [Nanoarchaeota archaeon]